MKSIQALLNLNPKNARLADEFIEVAAAKGKTKILIYQGGARGMITWNLWLHRAICGRYWQYFH